MSDLSVSTCKVLAVFSLPCPPEGNGKSSFGGHLASSQGQPTAAQSWEVWYKRELSLSAWDEGEVKACYKGADAVPSLSTALTSEVLEFL